MKLVLEESNNIEVRVFDINKFEHSAKALWLNRKYAKSFPRLEERVAKYFIPIYYVAKKDNMIYISKYSIDKFIKEYADNINELEKTFPKEDYSRLFSYDRWVEFQKQYPYKKSDK